MLNWENIEKMYLRSVKKAFVKSLEGSENDSIERIHFYISFLRKRGIQVYITPIWINGKWDYQPEVSYICEDKEVFLKCEVEDIETSKGVCFSDEKFGYYVGLLVAFDALLNKKM